METSKSDPGRDAPTVVKVGGSLLDWPELPRRLEGFLTNELEQGRQSVLVVGGGAAADVIRAMDRIHGLGRERAHALAIRAMDLTAALLAALAPWSRLVTTLDELEPAWRDARIPALAPRRFLDELDAYQADPLPASWDVTSDSIAARLARHLGAARLVLLKSRQPSGSLTLTDAARTGLVDPYFPTAAAWLARVEVVCLRDTPATRSLLAP